MVLKQALFARKSTSRMFWSDPFPHLPKTALQCVGNFFSQRFHLLYTARTGEVHDPNECFSFADHDHPVC